MDGNTGGLVNDNEPFVFVNNSDGEACDRGFVAVGGVGDDLAVFDDGFWVGSHTIDGYKAFFKGGSLVIVSPQFSCAKQSTYIILRLPIAKLGREDLHQLTTAPSLLAVGVIGIVVGFDATESTIQIVWCSPGIAGGHDHVRGLLHGLGGGHLVDIHEGHCGLWREF